MAELFGFQITRKKQEQDPKQNFTTPQADDGTTTVAAGGYFGSYLDMEGTAKNEADLVRRYREISLHPECDQAIEDICNEAIVSSEEKDSVRNFQPPITGEEIMELFNLKPSREIGTLKEAVKEAILEGEIANEYEAAYHFVLKRAEKMWLKTV